MNQNDYYKNDFVDSMFYGAIARKSKLMVMTSSGIYIGFPAVGKLNDGNFENIVADFQKLQSKHDPEFNPFDKNHVMKSITLTDVQILESNSSTKIPTKHLVIFVSDITGIALA